MKESNDIESIILTKGNDDWEAIGCVDLKTSIMEMSRQDITRNVFNYVIVFSRRVTFEHFQNGSMISSPIVSFVENHKKGRKRPIETDFDSSFIFNGKAKWS